MKIEKESIRQKHHVNFNDLIQLIFLISKEESTPFYAYQKAFFFFTQSPTYIKFYPSQIFLESCNVIAQHLSIFSQEYPRFKSLILYCNYQFTNNNNNKRFKFRIQVAVIISFTKIMISLTIAYPGRTLICPKFKG